MFRQRHCCHANAAVRRGILGAQVAGNTCHVRSSLINCNTWLQTANDFQISRLALGFHTFIFFLRAPKLLIDVEQVKTEIWSHNADDSHWLFVERQFCADNVWIAAEPTLPQSVTQNNDVSLARVVFLRRKNTTVKWCSSKHVKEAF